MRRTCIWMMLAAIMTLNVSVLAQTGEDFVRDFNSAWQFHGGDIEGADAPDFDDSNWRKVDLPHDWSIESPFSSQWAAGTGFLPGGIGWYRKDFMINAADAAKRIMIEFEGVYRNSDVWINGHHLGFRPYGYINFGYALTPYLNASGVPNVIAVRVDHSEYADSRWYTGSGITRNVRLHVTDPLHFPYHSLYVTTPEVGDGTAIARVEASVRNDGAEMRRVELQVRILDGETVKAQESQTIVLEPNAEMNSYTFLDLKEFERWDIDSPTLYTAEAQLIDDGQLLDRKVAPLGIREFRFDPAEGFFLNGRNHLLKGVCLHHDAGALGAAVPKEVWRRRLETLQTLGVNAIRTSHNPPDPGLLELCDAMGFLVMAEAFDEFSPPKRKWVEGWNQGTPSLEGYGEVFPEWSQRDMAAFIKRDRNHPSIILWSIGNEIDYPNDPYTFESMGDSQGQDGWRRFDPERPNARMMIQYGRPLAAIIRDLDPTRPVTMAMANRPVVNAIGLPDLLDVVGYNYQEVNYEEDHATYPDRVYIGSETRHDFEAWTFLRDSEYISGQFLWTGIDYLGEANRFPSRAAGSGLLDLAGFVKPRGQFRKALWTDAPMIWAGQGSRRGGGFAGRSGIEGWFGEPGAEREVTVFTNCATAELFLNGQSLGRKTRSEDADPTLLWEGVEFQPGELKAVGYGADEAVAEYVVHSSGDPAKLVADVYPVQAGDRTAQIVVELQDAEGVRCWLANPTMTVSVDGPARLMGIEGGDTSELDLYQDASQPLYRGRALVFIALTESDSTATIRVEGIDPVKVSLGSR